jgi:predicted site-specific integrase-resolvase
MSKEMHITTHRDSLAWYGHTSSFHLLTARECVLGKSLKLSQHDYFYSITSVTVAFAMEMYRSSTRTSVEARLKPGR